MKNLFKSMFLISLFSINYAISAQKTLDKGTVVMEIDSIVASDPQMEMLMGAMKGTQTELVFEENKHVTNLNMMGGMFRMKILVNSDENKVNTLFDGFGKKSWVESGLDSQSANEKAIAEKSEITYDKSQTKEILGYKCYKMTINNPEMQDVTVTGYITPDIKTKANLIQGFQTLKFEGYPMEFTVISPQFAMRVQAKDLKDSVDESKFTLDTKGYKKMTMEEFQKEMAQMGMGF